MKKIVKDLLAIVGGAGTNTDIDDSSTGQQRHLHTAQSSKSSHLKAPAPNKGKFSGDNAKASLNTGRESIAAQKVIPLDDDDFKQF